MPPANWAIQYEMPSTSFIRPDATNPSVTAGLTWQPEMGPMA